MALEYFFGMKDVVKFCVLDDEISIVLWCDGAMACDTIWVKTNTTVIAFTDATERDEISKRRMHVVDKRRSMSTKLAQLRGVTVHRYTKVKMEREQKGDSRSARIVPPKQVPRSREQNITKSEEKREIQIAPPIEWVPQKGISGYTGKCHLSKPRDILAHISVKSILFFFGKEREEIWVSFFIFGLWSQEGQIERESCAQTTKPTRKKRFSPRRKH